MRGATRRVRVQSSGYVRRRTRPAVGSNHRSRARSTRWTLCGQRSAARHNLPLTIFLAATAVWLAFRPDGGVGTATSVIGTVALVWWAADEVLRGDSPFRHVLGAVVLVVTVIGALTG